MEVPLFRGIFTPYDPPILWRILGAYFLLIWGVGVVRIIFNFSVKKGFFSEKGGGNSVNQGFGKDFYRKGNSVKRFGPFTEPPDSEN